MILGSTCLIIVDFATCFDFSNILNIIEYFLCHSATARFLKKNCIPPAQLSLMIHIYESMRSSSLGTTCHRDEDLLLDNKFRASFEHEGVNH